MSYTVTVIVPAYNEEKFLNKVLKPLSTFSFIDEVICVNDGSTDGTERIARSFPRVKTINMPTNGGKSAAVVAGITAAKGDIIVFMDADLLGISKHTLRQMTQPLVQQKYDAVLGYAKGIRYNGPLTGERAYFRKDILLHLNTLRSTNGYGLELVLNYLYRNKKTYHLTLDNVVQQPKKAKYGKQVGLTKELGMLKQIVREILAQERPVVFLYESYIKCYHIRTPRLFARIHAKRALAAGEAVR